MDYSFLSLRAVGLLVGLLLLASHAIALVRSESVRRFLLDLPRSRPAGIALLTLAALWTFWLWSRTDLGEFYRLRPLGQVLIPIGWFLMLRYVDEFLAARALGILLLLAADPPLEAAFLRPPATRLLLVALAYVWIVAGMFLVGKPHLLRDALGWLSRSLTRWRLAVYLGLGYGALLFVCALTW